MTSALVLLVSAALSDGSGTHVYVIDGRGDQALRTLERSPNCAGVVRTTERERLIRVIHRLSDEIGERIGDPAPPRPGGLDSKVCPDRDSSFRPPPATAASSILTAARAFAPCLSVPKVSRRPKEKGGGLMAVALSSCLDWP